MPANAPSASRCHQCKHTAVHPYAEQMLLCTGNPPQLLQRYGVAPLRSDTHIGATAAYPLVHMNAPACRLFEAGATRPYIPPPAEEQSSE